MYTTNKQPFFRLIWRVEHPQTGVGVFQSLNHAFFEDLDNEGDDDLLFEMGDRVRLLHEHLENSGLLTPQQDFDPAPVWGAHGWQVMANDDDEWFFGTDSLEKLTYWMLPDQLEFWQKLGFMVRIYDVPLHCMRSSRSGFQVMFKPEFHYGDLPLSALLDTRAFA